MVALSLADELEVDPDGSGLAIADDAEERAHGLPTGPATTWWNGRWPRSGAGPRSG